MHLNIFITIGFCVYMAVVCGVPLAYLVNHALSRDWQGMIWPFLHDRFGVTIIAVHLLLWPLVVGVITILLTPVLVASTASGLAHYNHNHKKKF